MYGHHPGIGAGYPRVVGYVAGPGYTPTGHGYYPGLGVYGASPAEEAAHMAAAAAHHGVEPHHALMAHQAWHHGGTALPVHPAPPPAVYSPPWRPMMAPGNPPLGEHHVPMPLTAETFGGAWGNTAGAGPGPIGAPPGTTITFSARPQKPYKTARLIARGTKTGPTANGNVIAQAFVGTSLQQAELGFFDLESIGAATAFDTWVSLHQAEPGVWIRIQCQLTAYPTGTDFEIYTISALGHYLQ